jgi:O-antigen/teichoic acid export membrane protein
VQKENFFCSVRHTMRRTFFQNLIFLVLLNLVIKPLWVLGIDRTVQNISGATVYGMYFGLSALTMMFSIVADFGITYYNNRQIARKPDQAALMLPNIVLMKFILSAAYLILTVFLAISTGISGHSLTLLCCLALNQIMLSIIIYLRSNISALHYFKTDSLLSICDKALMLLFFGVFLYNDTLRNHFSIDWFVYGQSICYILTLLFAFAINLHHIPQIKASFHLPLIKEIWHNSYPYAMVILFMAVYTRSDGWLLERLSGAQEAGFYATAYRLLDAVNQFGYLFAALLLPIFSRMLENGSNTKALLQTSFTVIFLFASLVLFTLWSSAFAVMQLLYHDATPRSGELLTVLMCSLYGSFGVYIFGTWLAASGKLKVLNTITGIAALASVTINLIVIPKYGAMGAALTALVINVFVATAEALVVMRHTQSKFSISRITPYILFLILCSTGTHLLIRYVELPWPLLMIITVVIVCLMANISRLIRLSDIAELRQLLRIN